MPINRAPWSAPYQSTRIPALQASMLFFNRIDSVSISRRHDNAHVSTTTDIYSHVIKEAKERISDCVADVILKPAKAKLRVVGE